VKLRDFIACSAAAAIAIVVTARTAGASDFATFRSPSGAIGCVYGDGTLRCDVAGGVKPLPPRPKSCELDWGQGFWLARKGRASIVCAGDTALNGSAQVVPYGMTWRRGAVACASTINGMHCLNVDGHGFTIARGESRSF